MVFVQVANCTFSRKFAILDCYIDHEFQSPPNSVFVANIDYENVLS